MVQQKPLNVHQQELINIVKVVHQNLATARKTRVSEQNRRNIALEASVKSKLDEELQDIARKAESDKLLLKLAAEKLIDELRVKGKSDLDAEVVAHEIALDDALIAAYEDGVPIRRIAIDGFGNRYEGGVQQLLNKIREDGRLGARTGYQRNVEDSETVVAFPALIDVNALLQHATSIAAPVYTPLPERLVLVEADKAGEGEISVPAVRLDMDLRDPYFASIARNAREKTPYLRATHCTLYTHPGTGELTVHESKESGLTTWDHPVARWVKEHKDEAEAGFSAAIKAEA